MKTILVADDEFDLAGTLRAILEGEGYSAEVCTNGREVLERLKARKPDLVLMDVMMPLMSGYDVLREMKRTPGLDGIPVVLMSAAPTRVSPTRAVVRPMSEKRSITGLVQSWAATSTRPCSRAVAR